MRRWARREKSLRRTWLTSLAVLRSPERETSSCERSCSAWANSCACFVWKRQRVAWFAVRGIWQRRPSVRVKRQRRGSALRRVDGEGTERFFWVERVFMTASQVSWRGQGRQNRRSGEEPEKFSGAEERALT